MCAHVAGERSPPLRNLSNGKISRRVPAPPTVAYLCGFISESPQGGGGGGVGGLPAFIRSPEHRTEGGTDG